MQITGTDAIAAVSKLTPPQCQSYTRNSYGSVTCTVHPRPVDTYGRSADERAWMTQHGITPPAVADFPRMRAAQWLPC